MTVELTAKTFLPGIARGTCLVVWYAPSSASWGAFSRVYAEASQRYPQALFAQIDAEREHELALDCGIERLPTVMAFRRGGLVFVRAGLFDPNAFDSLVRALLTGKKSSFAHN